MVHCVDAADAKSWYSVTCYRHCRCWEPVLCHVRRRAPTWTHSHRDHTPSSLYWSVNTASDSSRLTSDSWLPLFYLRGVAH